METKQNLLVLDEKGALVNAEEVEKLLSFTLEAVEKAKSDLENVRKELLQAMLETGLDSAKIGKYNVSVVKPKDTETFDDAAFAATESSEVVSQFANIKVIDLPFDVNRFKADHPELYEEYSGHDEVMEIDEKKLKKTLPEVYKKFLTVTPSQRETTLRIAETGAKK